MRIAKAVEIYNFRFYSISWNPSYLRLLRLTSLSWGNGLYRQVPISNLLIFFSKEGLPVDYRSWEDNLWKSGNTCFSNLVNKRWRHYDVIIHIKADFNLKKLLLGLLSTFWKWLFRKFGYSRRNNNQSSNFSRIKNRNVWNRDLCIPNLPNFGHMTTSTLQFDSRNKIWLVTP